MSVDQTKAKRRVVVGPWSCAIYRFAWESIVQTQGLPTLFGNDKAIHRCVNSSRKMQYLGAVRVRMDESRIVRGSNTSSLKRARIGAIGAIGASTPSSRIVRGSHSCTDVTDSTDFSPLQERVYFGWGEAGKLLEADFWHPMDSHRRLTLESHVAYPGSHRPCHEPSSPTDPRTRDCPVLPMSGWVAVALTSLPVALPQPSGAVWSWLTANRLPQGILARSRAVLALVGNTLGSLLRHSDTAGTTGSPPNFASFARFRRETVFHPLGNTTTHAFLNRL